MKIIDNIIENNLYELRANLAREGVEVEIEDFEYNLLDRCEHLAIKSETIYPDQDLPGKFGVYRGYGGGGVHTALDKTQIDRMAKNRQDKANRLLALFEDTFWQILEDIEAEAKATDPEREFWDSVKI